MRSGRRAAKLIALVTFIIVILVATPQAQQPVAFSGSSAGISAGPAAMVPDATSIDLLVGRSTILNVGGAIARVSLTVPDIADAMVTAPQQLLIHGKTPGTISLFVWDRAGAIKTYEVTVRRDLSRLVEQVKDLFPGEPITVTGSGKEVVLSGLVTSKYVHDKAAEVASGYVEKPEYVVNLLKQQEGVASRK
jgi:Flp pilus assembly secretin CpaC